ncbi:MAG: L,D-transpeptidase family protein [Gaiellales bacterium]
MARPSLRRATTATAVALLATMGGIATAEARPAHVQGPRIIDAQGHELKVRGVTWGGERFVSPSAATPLPAPDVASASRDFKRIQQMGANLVRDDVSSAAADDAHRLAFQKLQRLAKAHGLQILFANVPLDNQDQTTWLQTLASWFPQKPNVWYLPAVDPDCSALTLSGACGDTEAWIWSQGNAIRTLRSAGVRTPIVVNLPSASQSVSLNWATALADRNVVYGVHPTSGGHAAFTDQDGHGLTVSLKEATAKVPIVFDDIARLQTTVDLARSGPDMGGRVGTRATATTTDALAWSQGLLDWVTGWTLIDGGDGAIVDGFATQTKDEVAKGRKRFTAWGRTAASGYFAITFRAASGRDPGTGFPGGFAYGDKGPGVRDLQQNLARLGFMNATWVSGDYDYATWQAVTALQGYSRIDRTGDANAETIATLMRAERPVAMHPDMGRHIEVDISRQIVLLVNGDGSVRRVIHTSTGATDNTPDGQFTISRKERMSWDYKFKIWLPYASYFKDGFALHEYPDVPAYPASHGCVRIASTDSPYVWDFATMGTTVVLYHSA